MNIISFASKGQANKKTSYGSKKPSYLLVEGYFEYVSESTGKVRLKGIDEGMVLVNSENFNGAMHGDFVSVYYAEDRKRTGIIREVQHRAHSVCNGIIHKSGAKIILVPDDVVIRYPVLIVGGDKLNDGAYVSTQIIRYPTGIDPIIIVSPLGSIEMYSEKNDWVFSSYKYNLDWAA